MPTKIYLIKNKPAPWGDWGDILMYGFTRWDQKSNTTSVMRAGPFTPAAYLSAGNFVLTESVKNALTDSDLQGVARYQTLEKKKSLTLISVSGIQPYTSLTTSTSAVSRSL